MSSHSRPACLLAAFAVALAATTAWAQVRTLPEDARRGHLSFVQSNVVALDDKQVKLAPGAQIRGPGNLLVLPTALPRNSLVKYQLDGGGNLVRAWILSPQEAAQPDKYAAPALPWSTSPEQGRTMDQVLGTPPPSRIGLRPGDPPRDTTIPPGPGQSANP
ncbi:MAG TPA: hypothetical protein VLD36_01170 [Burkholderiales bacterium]|nr:hypothetical protein [Burkholderiales bacterium]